jgi:hypothetical protein
MVTNISYPNKMINNNSPKECIKIYTIDDFYEVKNNMRESLGDINYFSMEIRQFFEKMLQTIPYNRKKKIITDDDWRKRKTVQFIKKENQDQSEKIYQELKGYLNKISANNSQSILDEINKSLEMYTDDNEFNHYYSLLLADIFKKARMEPNYCILYIKIILGLNEQDIVKCFINEVKTEYKEILEELKPINEKNIETNQPEDDSNKDDDKDYNGENSIKGDENYDEFCLSRKHKNYQKGYSQFIGELYNSHNISLNELIIYWSILTNNIESSIKLLKSKEELFDNVQKSCVKSIEESVLYLSPLIETTIESVLKGHLHGHQNEKIQNIFKKIEEFSEDKIIVNKNRYFLADLVDLYNKNKKTKRENGRFRNSKPFTPTQGINRSSNYTHHNNSNNGSVNKQNNIHPHTNTPTHTHTNSHNYTNTNTNTNTNTQSTFTSVNSNSSSNSSSNNNNSNGNVNPSNNQNNYNNRNKMNKNNFRNNRN